MEKKAALSKKALIKKCNLKELRIVINRDECVIKAENIGLNNKRINKSERNLSSKGIADVNRAKKSTTIRDSQVERATDDKHPKYCDSYTNESNKIYKCELCPETFRKARALMLHSRFHLKVNGMTFKCSLCSATFQTNEELIKHKSIHDSEEHIFTCIRCKMAFTNHLNYLHHKLTHLKLPVYKCMECSYTYKVRRSLRDHISKHFTRKLKCGLCNEIFTQTKDIDKHRRKFHKPGKDCVECGKNFQTRRDLEEHMTMHTGVKVFQCLYCGKGFNKCSLRRNHTKKHTKCTPFECAVCLQKFPTSTQLKCHMISHNAKKRFECNDCGQQFHHRNSMVSHTRRHMGHMLYKCPACVRSFTTYQYLQDHALTAHVKIKRYKCELCNTLFTAERGLRKHLRTTSHLNNLYAAKSEKETR